MQSCPRNETHIKVTVKAKNSTIGHRWFWRLNLDKIR